MPGKKNSASTDASFITDFVLHRSGIVAADNPASGATIEAVTQTLDLTQNNSAHSNHIWIGVVRTAGAGTIDITLWRKETGTWFAIAPYTAEATQATMATATVKKFASLPAGLYRVLATNITGGSSWNLHASHSV